VTTPPRSLASRTAFIAFIAALAGLVAIVVIALHAERLGGVGPGRYRLLADILLWQAIAIIAATALRWVRPRRLAAGLIVAGVLALPAASLTHSSQISDDLYRYAWDGRLQAAGVDPYRYPPDAPQLQRFRDAWLWPTAATCVLLHKKVDAADPQHACTRINRPGVRTIYPPAAEGYFVLAHWLPGPPRDHKLQLDAAILSAALTGLLAFGLKRTGRDPLAAAYYSFGPLAGLDIAGDAHVDVLAAVFGVGALLLVTLKPRASGRTGVLVGLAIAVKLYPVLLLPALLRRGGGRQGALRLVAGAAGVLVLGYLPHVIAAGTHVLGYLPGYLHEENYDSGTRFLLLGLLGLGNAATKLLAAGAMATAIAVVVWQRLRDRMTPSEGALTVLGTAFLVATPSQPWYAILLVCAAVLTGRLEWIAVATAPYPLYFTALLHENSILAGRLAYTAAGVIVLIAVIFRRRNHNQQKKSGQWETDTSPPANALVQAARGPQPTLGGPEADTGFTFAKGEIQCSGPPVR
jgi:hypothetical protein